MTRFDTFISFDLETTGLDPKLHEIIEIGAVKVENGKIIDEFSQLVKPTTPIPEFITNLTGISNKDVKNAGPIDAIIPSFMKFIKGYRLLGQNVSFDVSFLRQVVGIGNVGISIDNIELARILLPQLPSFSLDSLIDFFAFNPENRHRALDDARVTAEIFLKLLDMLTVSGDDYVNEMCQLSQKTGSSLVEIFESHLFDRVNNTNPKSVSPKSEQQPATETTNNIFGNFTEDLLPITEARPAKLDLDAVADLLKEGGALSKNYEEYEERAGQIAFAAKVSEAFNDSELLLAEAGTGTGKSIAYLIPAIIFSESARERVIISTNTKNLQEQLFAKDIPLLAKVLGFPFRAAILKGRGNYVCLNRWNRLVASPGKFLSKPQKNLILPVASWLSKTVTGDLSETGFSPMLAETGLMEHINSESISCLGGRCKFRNECFVNRIRKAAQCSHIIIVNHSLVFSDMVTDGGVFGPYSRIVFDEAHNIEKVAIRYLGVTMGYYTVRRALNRLYSGEKQSYGLFVMLHEWAAKMAKGYPGFDEKSTIIDQAIAMVQAVRSTCASLIEHMNSAVRAAAEKTDSSHEGKLRYYADSDVFDVCKDEIDIFNETISTLIQTISEVSMLVSGVSSNHLADKDDIMIDLEKSTNDFQEIVNAFEFLMTASGPNVFWFDYNPSGNWITLNIKSAPLDVAEKLAVGLYDQMETVIMTSATLTVARDFKYFRERLGLDLDSRDRVLEFIAASPFNYQQQSAIVLPTYLPSPKSADYIDEVNDSILAIASGVRKGMLVLFTSRGHLQRSYCALSDTFKREGITLMAQGIDGSRNLLLRRFREEKSSVLFGTDSFWEGVDVPGSALEVVVIVRLPFAVPTDPVIQAQMEEIERVGGRPFMEYTVPEAAIKLRQGAGRLIRHRNDRGAIIVMDNRIVTTRYGSIFRKCLSGNEIRSVNKEMLVKDIKEWFED